MLETMHLIATVCWLGFQSYKTGRAGFDGWDKISDML